VGVGGLEGRSVCVGFWDGFLGIVTILLY
jgi:hypothetical protein